jgi:hypothetical protein
MDVGSGNFRFTLDDPEEKAKTYRFPKTAELHLDSLDRYNNNTVPAFNVLPNATQTDVKLMGNLWGGSSTTATNNCIIQTKRNLLYGYLSRVAFTQFQLAYKVPTVVTGVNDRLAGGFSSPGLSGGFVINIPQGFYSVVTLASTLQTLLRAAIAPFSALTVTPPSNQTGVTSPIQVGFTINVNAAASTLNFNVTSGTAAEGTNTAKALRLIGANRQSQGLSPTTPYAALDVPPGAPPAGLASFTMGPPNFRQTDYVDIVSQALTNYKDTKDGNSSIASPGSVIGRIWLTEYPLSGQASGLGWPQDGMWGMSPMNFTKTWDNPNWSQWSPNAAINTVDITLLDMWGQPLYWSDTYNTEWSATVTVTE